MSSPDSASGPNDSLIIAVLAHQKIDIGEKLFIEYCSAYSLAQMWLSKPGQLQYLDTILLLTKLYIFFVLSIVWYLMNLPVGASKMTNLCFIGRLQTKWVSSVDQNLELSISSKNLNLIFAIFTISIRAKNYSEVCSGWFKLCWIIRVLTAQDAFWSKAWYLFTGFVSFVNSKILFFDFVQSYQSKLIFMERALRKWDSGVAELARSGRPLRKQRDQKGRPIAESRKSIGRGARIFRQTDKGENNSCLSTNSESCFSTGFMAHRNDVSMNCYLAGIVLRSGFLAIEISVEAERDCLLEKRNR